MVPIIILHVPIKLLPFTCGLSDFVRFELLVLYSTTYLGIFFFELSEIP